MGCKRILFVIVPTLQWPLNTGASNIGPLLMRIGFWGAHYTIIIIRNPKVVLVIIKALIVNPRGAEATGPPEHGGGENVADG